MSVEIPIRVKEVSGGYQVILPELTFSFAIEKIGKLTGKAMLTQFGGGTPGTQGGGGGAGPPSNRTGVGALLFTGTGVLSDKPPIVDASIPIRDVFFNIIGYGPSPVPYGIFFNRTDLVLGAKWRFGTVPGLTLSEFPGGDFDANGPAGTYNLPWVLHNNGLVEVGVKTGVILS